MCVERTLQYDYRCLENIDFIFCTQLKSLILLAFQRRSGKVGKESYASLIAQSYPNGELDQSYSRGFMQFYGKGETVLFSIFSHPTYGSMKPWWKDSAVNFLSPAIHIFFPNGLLAYKSAKHQSSLKIPITMVQSSTNRNGRTGCLKQKLCSLLS